MGRLAVLAVALLCVASDCVLAKGKSRISQQTHKIEVGESTTLSCFKDEANPPNFTRDPATQWFYNNIEISFNEELYPDLSEKVVEGLELADRYTLNVSVKSTSRNGTFICNILPHKYRSKIRHHLLVYKPLKVEEGRLFDEYNLKVGKTVKLQCPITGWPYPKIVWTRADGKSLPNELGKKAQTNFLSFFSDRNHGGEYTCKATNRFESLSASTKIIVHFSPEVVNHSASSVHARLNSGKQLFCVISGGPRPNITWKFESNDPATNSWPGFDSITTKNIDYSTVKSTIKIEQVETNKFGKFRCEGSNPYGSAVQSIVLSGKPGPVQVKRHQVCQYRDACVIEVKSDAVNDAEVHGYRISVIDTNGNMTDSLIWRERLPILLDNLVGGDLRRELQITAFNDHGDGMTSRVVIDVHPGAEGAPKNIREILWPATEPVKKSLDGSSSSSPRSGGYPGNSSPKATKLVLYFLAPVPVLFLCTTFL